MYNYGLHIFVFLEVSIFCILSSRGQNIHKFMRPTNYTVKCTVWGCVVYVLSYGYKEYSTLEYVDLKR